MSETEIEIRRNTKTVKRLRYVNVPSDLPEELPHTARNAYGALRGLEQMRPGFAFTSQDIADATGRPLRTTQRAIASLVEAELVSSWTMDRSAVYVTAPGGASGASGAGGASGASGGATSDALERQKWRGCTSFPDQITSPSEKESRRADARDLPPDLESFFDDLGLDDEERDEVDVWAGPLSRRIAGEVSKLRGVSREHDEPDRFRSVARQLVAMDCDGTLDGRALAEWCVQNERMPVLLDDGELDEVAEIYERLDAAETARHDESVAEHLRARGIDPDSGDYVDDEARRADEERERAEERAGLVRDVDDLEAQLRAAVALRAAHDAAHGERRRGLAKVQPIGSSSPVGARTSRAVS